MYDPGVALLIAVGLLGIGGICFWPGSGLWFRWRQAQQSTDRVRREDALKHIYKCEIDGQQPSLDSMAGALQIRCGQAAELVAQMQADGLLETVDGGFGLTPTGRETALHIIRAHRLWERHLADETGFAASTWHAQAEEIEHTLSPTDADALAERLGNPTHDPHGDPIPTASGRVASLDGQPLTALPLDTPARIIHLEDEPAVVYAQLLAEGLTPGMVVRVTDSQPHQLRFWSEMGEHVLAPIVAAHLLVAPLPAEPDIAIDARHLSDLAVGETARVLSLSPRCRGAERRRFMDLGILPGTSITAEYTSPGGNPTAYRIRNSLIALRRNQAALINMYPEESEEPHGQPQ